jgi:hypothetical protein
MRYKTTPKSGAKNTTSAQRNAGCELRRVAVGPRDHRDVREEGEQPDDE